MRILKHQVKIMLSAAPIRGDGTYYQQLAQTEYYTKGGEPPGHWVGSGAEQLGLIGQAITPRVSRICLVASHRMAKRNW